MCLSLSLFLSFYKIFDRVEKFVGILQRILRVSARNVSMKELLHFKQQWKHIYLLPIENRILIFEQCLRTIRSIFPVLACWCAIRHYAVTPPFAWFSNLCPCENQPRSKTRKVLIFHNTFVDILPSSCVFTHEHLLLIKIAFSWAKIFFLLFFLIKYQI